MLSPFKRLSSFKLKTAEGPVTSPEEAMVIQISDDACEVASPSSKTPPREDLKLNLEGNSSSKKTLQRPKSEYIPRSLVKAFSFKLGRSKSMRLSESNKDALPTPPNTPTTSTRDISAELFKNTNLNPDYVVFGHQTYNFVYNEKTWEDPESQQNMTAEEMSANSNFHKVQNEDGTVSYLLQNSASTEHQRSAPSTPTAAKRSKSNKLGLDMRSPVERFEEENLHPEYVAFNHPRYHFIYDGRTLDEHTLIFTQMRLHEDKSASEYVPPKLTKVWNDDGTFFFSVERSNAPAVM